MGTLAIYNMETTWATSAFLSMQSPTYSPHRRERDVLGSYRVVRGGLEALEEGCGRVKTVTSGDAARLF